MATKQLEILVAARDTASDVLRGVGDSSQGLSNQLRSLNDIAEAGHGMHSLLRQARNVGIAFEVIPVGVDAVKAAYATLNGSTEEAASGQRQLYNAIKELPLVGKFLGPAVEAMGSAIAHAFGAESTRDIEEEMAKKKAALEGFAEEVKKIRADLGKEDEKASMIGLFPSDQQIEKAKQQYATQMEQIHKLHQYAMAQAQAEEADVANGSRLEMAENSALGIHKFYLNQKATDTSATLALINKLQADADKIQANEIQQAHLKELQENREFAAKLEEQEQARIDSINEMQAESDRAALEEQGRGFEAKLAGISQGADKQIAALKAGLKKQQEEDQKEIDSLQGVAQSGGPDAAKAQKRIGQLQDSSGEAVSLEAVQEQMVKKRAAEESAAARNEELKRTQLDLLQQQADAGDKGAEEQLKQAKIADDLNTKYAALQAILKAGTAEEKAQAQIELQQLATQQKKLDAIKAQAEAEKEQQEYDETDRKIQLAMQREDAKNAKPEARQAKKDEAVGPADLEASQYLTGVTARAQQQKAEYDPIIQAQKESTGVIQQIRDMFQQWVGMGQNQIRPVTKLR